MSKINAAAPKMIDWICLGIGIISIILNALAAENVIHVGFGMAATIVFISLTLIITKPWVKTVLMKNRVATIEDAIATIAYIAIMAASILWGVEIIVSGKNLISGIALVLNFAVLMIEVMSMPPPAKND